jgi:hypothetical protein
MEVGIFRTLLATCEKRKHHPLRKRLPWALAAFFPRQSLGLLLKARK